MALRLKEARSRIGLTQAAVALQLGTTQQTYQRWEQGKTEPSIEQLQDLARVLRTTPMMLLAPREVEHDREESDRELCENSTLFWGHAGIVLRGWSEPFYYPVSEEGMHQLGIQLATHPGEDLVIGLTTLADKEVFFRPSALARLHLVDDAADFPEGSGTAAELIGVERGHSREVYRAMADLVGVGFALEGLVGSGEKDDSGDLYRELVELFQSEGVDALGRFSPDPRVLEAAALALAEARLDIEEAHDRLKQTRVWMQDGAVYRFQASEASLLDVIEAIDGGMVTFLALEDVANETAVFFSWDQVAMIEMPMHQLESGTAAEDEEFSEILSTIDGESLH